MDEATIRLFSYGTLQQPEVQRALFGRDLASEADVLCGFVLGTIPITDEEVIGTSGLAVHLIAQRAAPDSEVPGVTLSITPAELARADHYEAEDYARISVVLKSGRTAFVYVDAREV